MTETSVYRVFRSFIHVSFFFLLLSHTHSFKKTETMVKPAPRTTKQTNNSSRRDDDEDHDYGKSRTPNRMEWSPQSEEQLTKAHLKFKDTPWAKKMTLRGYCLGLVNHLKRQGVVFPSGYTNRDSFARTLKKKINDLLLSEETSAPAEKEAAVYPQKLFRETGADPRQEEAVSSSDGQKTIQLPGDCLETAKQIACDQRSVLEQVQQISTVQADLKCQCESHFSHATSQQRTALGALEWLQREQEAQRATIEKIWERLRETDSKHERMIELMEGVLFAWQAEHFAPAQE